MDCEFIKARVHPTWFSVLSAQHAVRSSQRLIDVDQENGCECDEIYFVFLGGWADARQTYSSKDQVMFLFLVCISGKRRRAHPSPVEGRNVVHIAVPHSHPKVLETSGGSQWNSERFSLNLWENYAFYEIDFALEYFPHSVYIWTMEWLGYFISSDSGISISSGSSMYLQTFAIVEAWVICGVVLL